VDDNAALAWQAYRDRRFDLANARAAAVERLAGTAAEVGRARAVAGRIAHACGDLATAERLLAATPDAEHHLGVLRCQQGRYVEALELLGTGPAAGFALAMTRRPLEALEAASGNVAGWILRNLGAVDAGRDLHRHELEVSGRSGDAETAIAALLHLVEDAVERGEMDAAARRWEEAESSCQGDLVFGWWLELRLRLLRARLALAQHDRVSAAMVAGRVAARAEELGIPRYAVPARLVGQWAAERSDREAAAVDLAALEQVASLESWWWTGRTGAALRVPAWVDLAGERMAALAGTAGEYADGLRSHAEPRLARWRELSLR
jgi:hypothetical protein